MIVTPSVIIVKRGVGRIKTVRTYANLASLSPLFPHSGYGTNEIAMKIAPSKMGASGLRMGNLTG
jgi:hypothetical protein